MFDKAKLKKLGIVVGIVLALAGGAYAFGRYMQPAKVITKTETVVKTETKIEYKDRIHKVEVQGPTHTVVIHEQRPDGSSTTTTTTDTGPVVINTDTQHQTNTHTSTEEHKTETKIVENQKPQWLVTGGVDLSAAALFKGKVDAKYDLEVQKRVFGPVFAGVAVETKTLDFGNIKKDDVYVGVRVTVEF